MTNDQLENALNKIYTKKHIIEEKDKYRKSFKTHYSQKPKFSFYIDKNDKKFIDSLIKDYGISQSQFVNNAVAFFIDRIEELKII